MAQEIKNHKKQCSSLKQTLEKTKGNFEALDKELTEKQRLHIDKGKEKEAVDNKIDDDKSNPNSLNPMRYIHTILIAKEKQHYNLLNKKLTHQITKKLMML